jgi:hypothetical protein
MSRPSHSNLGSAPKNLGSEQIATSLQELADPRPRGDKIKTAIQRAARRAGLSYWRAFDLWYGKARRIEQYECDAIADAVAAKRDQEARNELHDLRLRLARLETLLVQTDPDFHRPVLDALGSPLRRRG